MSSIDESRHQMYATSLANGMSVVAEGADQDGRQVVAGFGHGGVQAVDTAVVEIDDVRAAFAGHAHERGRAPRRLGPMGSPGSHPVSTKRADEGLAPSSILELVRMKSTSQKGTVSIELVRASNAARKIMCRSRRRAFLTARRSRI